MKILDACCGAKMFWYEKELPFVTFQDIRAGESSGVMAVLTPDRIEKRQNGRRVKEPGEPSFTVTAQDRHGVMLSDGRTCCIRKLTPKECWRLQGFTDNQYEKAAAINSKSQLYKQAGNAVTVNVVEEIGRHIMKIIEEDRGEQWKE